MIDMHQSLIISQAEAIVLFELLSRFEADGKVEVKASAEEKVLWHIQAQLEKSLVEPFSEKWAEILQDARKKVDAEY